MRALLLALVVVTFVYSGYTLICHDCTGPYCMNPVTCDPSEIKCAKEENRTGIMVDNQRKFCAADCTNDGLSSVFMCCSTDMCNY